MRIFFLLMLFSTLLASESRAGEVRAIELTDGSIVTGEVVSLSNGKYTVHSGSLGTVQIEESKILAIRPVAAPAAASSGAVPGVAADVRTLQGRMMNDQEVMSMIQSLQNDPEFMKIIEDPEVMKAVNAGDISALTADPRFLKLMDNSTVQGIAQKVR